MKRGPKIGLAVVDPPVVTRHPLETAYQDRDLAELIKCQETAS
jgi:hypothetical protein